MPRQMWKYRLNDPGEITELHIPGWSKNAYFGLQASFLTLWIEVDLPASGGEPERNLRKFVVVGTGTDAPPKGRYIGTVMEHLYVWHLYEILP